MADEDDISSEDAEFAKITRLQKEANKRLRENTEAVNRLRQAMNPFSTGGGSGATQHTQLSQGLQNELKQQTDVLRRILQKLNSGGGGGGRPGAGGGKDHTMGDVYGANPGYPVGNLSMIFKQLPTAIKKTFEPITRIFSPMLKSMANIGGKVWGGLKKSGLLPGVFAGIGIAVGAVIAKVIQASPLLTAMMKMMNMGITLMLRPIGDFIGSVLRPMMTYFIKDVAVPFFQATKGLVNDGGKIGKGLLAFFIQPIESIGAAIIKALNTVLPTWMVPGGEKALGAANMMFEDPARMFRERNKIGEFKYSPGKGADLRPSDTEWINMLQGTKVQGLGEDNDVFTGSKSDIEWLMKEREKDPIMAQHYTTSRWKQLAKDREYNALYGKYGTSSGLPPTGGYGDVYPGGGGGVGGGGIPIVVGEGQQDFWTWLTGLFNPLPEAAADTGEALDGVTDSLDLFDGAFDGFLEGLGKGWADFTVGINQWAAELGAGFDKWVEGLGTDFEKWTASTGTWIDGVWEWIANFGKVNEAFAEEGEKIVENEKNWGSTIMDWVESIKIAILGTEVATDSFADAIENAAQKVVDAANIATGGIFGGGNTGAGGDDPRGDKNEKDVVAGQYDVQPKDGSPRGEGNVFGTGTGAVATADNTGWSNTTLGQYSDNKFESSPGKFVDIYSDGKKVDPGSKEGKKIQAIYQKQYENKQKNAEIKAKQAQVTKTITTAYSPGDAAKARVIAGGGEAGLAAAKFVSDNKLSMTSYGDLVKLGDKFGINHPMIKTAREGLAKQIKMAKTIMQSRINAGQTPSIQGDMLGLFPDAEDSPFGWSDEKLTAQEALYQKNYAEYAALSAGTSNTSATGYTASASDTGGGTLTSGNFGGTDTSSGWGAIGGGTTTSLGSPGMSGGNPGRTTGGGAGAARSARSGGGRSTGRSTGGAKSGGGSSSKGGAGAARSSRGGSKSGASGASKSGGGSGSKGGAGSARSSRGRGGKKEFGGIIDEPIVGIGIHTGEEYLFGESGRELITPISAGESMGGGGDIVINIGNITKEADYMKLKPLIQRWILEASSRRGTV